MAGPIDDDLSFLLIKMAVSSWIEEILIEHAGLGWAPVWAAVEAYPCPSMTWPRACDKTVQYGAEQDARQKPKLNRWIGRVWRLS